MCTEDIGSKEENRELNMHQAHTLEIKLKPHDILPELSGGRSLEEIQNDHKKFSNMGRSRTKEVMLTKIAELMPWSNK